MKGKKIWGLLVVLIILAGAAYFFRDQLLVYAGAGPGQSNRASRQSEASADQQPADTVKIRPATDSAQVSAAGNIALASQQSTVFLVGGIVTAVKVDIGDAVAAGEVVVTLDSSELERAVRQAELGLAIKQAQLDKLLEAAEPAEIAAAEANLAAARENLAELKGGSGSAQSAAQLAAAQAKLSAAQERYQELLSGKNEAELTQLGAELQRTFITLEQAQQAYDQIAYRGDIGRTQQAMALQEATIDYDVAKAGFELATEPASAADLQEALSSIREAESQIAALNPSPADIAAAEAQVINAEATLAQLLSGPSQADRREAELNLTQAELNLEDAKAVLALTQLRAPRPGTVLTVDVEVGQMVSAGAMALSLADLSDLELSVNVAEVDIGKVRLNQPAEITLDALPDATIRGEVIRVAPTSQSESGVVNYGVTLRLDPADLAGVRPGMTAVATMSDESTAAGWLVPTNALVEFEGETTVLLVRDGQQERVEVTPLSSQGEWTIVSSAGLKAGDEVVGQVATFVNDDDFGPRGPFGPPR